ncbi:MULTISPECIES: 1,4-dihydroxy-2-naphthoate polyprenyltransferase [unclassified Lentimicrobium]|uniref:1,4-dihydroxy-2-naphthoate polyprenyltransferase n=1 Tax=unclassified Lentimicrobium TaxID=2677434 RepID=UPI001552A629|nr:MULTISPECIES: 1,4-dihydroxy-2-naphthoate polyprenyltransferase [unclassified Lentimicrobium]NPD46760.1 1,4-dihydroxy-2-naphthoate polyprenyltransferase [Lentimicrobium sp. S6]NPD85663.1 1,4-dihydroxy-2-naphthoate polyprenyltransferase [Lentimicrobium sp. L6]
MSKFNNWLNAFRLRTLPLALASILMGIAASEMHGVFNLDVSIFAIITTLFLQILSNLANDYGDGIKGTDNENRLGPKRTIQSGLISIEEMRNAIIVFSIFSLVSGLYLVYISQINILEITIFILLGVFAILAAIFYTVGEKSYGYRGWGDIFVFLFFGLLAVLGSFYLNAKYFSLDVVFPAITVGLLSTAVLNLNNIRDLKNDKENGKMTIAVKLGVKRAKFYHTLLINLAFFALLLFVSMSATAWQNYFVFFMYPFFLMDLLKIDKETDLKKLDPYLKKTALKTFLLVLIFTLLVFIY